jgi:hypothetical protein
VDTCAHCGGELPANATFCPSCGRRTTAAAEREGPIDVQHAEPRYFGLAPPVFVFAAAVTLLVLGVVLLLTGVFAVGVIAIVVAATLLPAFLAGARRWPDSRIAQLGVSTAERVRDEAGVAAESVTTWGRASREIARLRREQFGLRRERDGKIRELGAAVYADQDERAGELKAAARELDRRLEENERTLQRTIAGARRRMRKERAAVVTTEKIEAEENPLAAGSATEAEPDQAPERQAEPEVKPGDTAIIPEQPEAESEPATERAPAKARDEKPQARSR